MTGGRGEDGLSAQALSGDEDLVLPEFDQPPADPLRLLRGWLRDAATCGVREPAAVVLATVDPTGHPSTRTVLLKDCDGDGLVVSGSHGSRKGCDLAVVPWAAVTLYWRETLQRSTSRGGCMRCRTRPPTRCSPNGPAPRRRR